MMPPSVPGETMKETVVKKFAYALVGLKEGWKSESSFRFQVVIGMLVVLAGLLFQVSRFEWLFLSLAIGMVLSLEMINTVLEKFLDIVHPELGERVRIVKDMAAGVVFIASLTATVIGLLVFIPYLQKLL